MLLAFGVLWAAWIVSFISMFPFISYIGPSPWLLSSIGGLAVFNTIAIPILGLMLLITRWFSSYRIPNKWRTNLRLAWVVSFVVALMTVFGTVASFNNKADYSTMAEYSSTEGVLEISDLPIPRDEPVGIISSPIPHAEIVRGALMSDDVSINIVKSKNDKLTLETNRHAHGRTFGHAQSRVQEIKADHIFTDESLKLPLSFSIKKGGKYRGQEVDYILHVPEGKALKFTPGIASKIWRNSPFRDNIHPKNLEKYVWTMTDQGLASIGWDEVYRAERLVDSESLENLNIDGRIATTVEYGEETKILIKGPKTEIDKVEKIVTDGTTSLLVSGWLSDRVTMEITTPRLNSLQAKGLRSLKIEGFKQKDMELNFSGDRYMTAVKAYVDVENLTCNIGGENEVTLVGSGKNLIVNVLDGAQVIAEHYKTQNVTVKGNIYNNSSFYAIESFVCPDNERRSVTLYGNPALLTEMRNVQ